VERVPEEREVVAVLEVLVGLVVLVVLVDLVVLEGLVDLEVLDVLDVLEGLVVLAVLVAPLVRVVRLPKVRSVDVEVVRAGPAVAPVRPPAEAPTCVWRVLRPGPAVWSERALVIPALRLEKLRSG
jgi:hypothetical protein